MSGVRSSCETLARKSTFTRSASSARSSIGRVIRVLSQSAATTASSAAARIATRNARTRSRAAVTTIESRATRGRRMQSPSGSGAIAASQPTCPVSSVRSATASRRESAPVATARRRGRSWRRRRAVDDREVGLRVRGATASRSAAVRSRPTKTTPITSVAVDGPPPGRKIGRGGDREQPLCDVPLICDVGLGLERRSRTTSSVFELPRRPRHRRARSTPRRRADAPAASTTATHSPGSSRSGSISTARLATGDRQERRERRRAAGAARRATSMTLRRTVAASAARRAY